MNNLPGFLLLCSLLLFSDDLYSAPEDPPLQNSYQSTIARESLIIGSADAAQKVPALIRRGEAYRAAGHFREARSDLQKAVALAKEAGSGVLEAAANYALGTLLFQQQKDAAAQKHLQAAKEQAERLHKPQLVAAAANTLGSVYADQKLPERAAGCYRDALRTAEEIRDAGLIVAVRINLARLRDTSKQEQLDEAWKAAGEVPERRERAELLLGIAGESSRSGGKTMRLFAYKVLREVLDITDAATTPRLHSLANGELGALYEQEGRMPEAQVMTERAIMDAQQISSDDLLLRWQWRLGRLYRAQGDRNRAISAYRQAIHHLEAIRTDIPVTYQGGRSSFRETLAPI
jgi:tetratricopeptide (TPR) repeat protein